MTAQVLSTPRVQGHRSYGPNDQRAARLTAYGTTAARPATTALSAGHRYFDTTLGLPIWWDGTNWINAAGATV